MDGYTITTDLNKMDLVFVHSFLKEKSYWAKGIDFETVKESMNHSLCFGIFVEDTEEQVGFARVVTDYATFGYMADVFVVEAYRGRGLSKWLISEIMDHPDLQRLRRLMLVTKDAQGLYEQFGFEIYDNDDNGLMSIRRKAEDLYR
ncbi:GNAT family N-acetyltransferase [Pseudalkalibacillus berkeleyi]|uniref:GNAT family N-acetyltransferase n=1 Tax=Pseudalkalibacillus berkeleyi TaxID=1069813 RepID=A0ABS9H018_9BACL|nr:GNAT family N-acetyltransferase [Pseudalkalibacillus berkeleyi]MCF6138347.1 GNAT family N-acetyltransferase [Pseudalkalibacillus berkeleyi]